MTACDEMKVLISGLLDNELDQEAERTLLAHLGACAECRAERSALESISRNLRTTAREIPAPPPWETLELALAQRTLRRSPGAPHLAPSDGRGSSETSADQGSAAPSW